MLLSAPPDLLPSKLVQNIKGRSSRKLQDEFQELRKRYWAQHLWARWMRRRSTRFLWVTWRLWPTELAKGKKWFHNGSMDITVKRIPEEIYKVIKREAKEQGRSLNAEIIRTLEAQAVEVERRRNLGALRKELDRFAQSLPALSNSAPLIRRDRNR